MEADDVCPRKRAKKSVLADTAKKTVCPLCGAAFSGATHLRRHVRTLHKNVETDDVCPRMSMKRPFDAVQSMRPDTYTCTVCAKKYPLRIYLQCHIRRMHGLQRKRSTAIQCPGFFIAHDIEYYGRENEGQEGTR